MKLIPKETLLDKLLKKNETSGRFEILCNISDNTGTTDNSILQTCLSDVFINIEFHFSCNNSDQQQETFLASYPYDNITYNVTDSCDEPFLQELKLLNQSSDVYWSVCEKMSKKVMTNCSVRCNGNTCSINTICVREIDHRCLIPKYVRLTYECEQDSKMSESSCHKINETITISCDMGLLENQQLSITYQPSEVGDCLQINNLTFKFKPDVYPFYSNMSKGEATLSHMFTTKPHRGTTDTFSSERTSTTNSDMTNSVDFVESSTTSVVQTKIEPVSVGTIIGATVGSILLAVVFGVIVYWRRVYMMKHNTDRGSENVVGFALPRNSLKDYTGVQMVAYPGESSVQLTTDKPIINTYTVVSGDTQNKFKNDQIDHFKGKRIDIEIEHSATGYSLVRPNSNELQLPNMQLQMSQADSGYGLAKRISKEHNNKGNYSHSSSDNITSKDYEISPEGVYDRSNSRRNKNDIDVYDRAVDNTYDTADHNNKQRTDDDGNAYDHFIGPKTNDNYEQVIRNNKVVSDDTYGVH
ncbi:unnamed protein product [Mytilus edulis]|uniref:Uncharacterized protein n=1 Tax=Mytilus edulis TaxID=6550 RepID=A0A8S3PYI1_MYTED|nr:unnamed protein product [Mytilus edulis]